MTRRRPGRPSRQVLTREQILEAALAMLEEHGLDALTIRAVARRLRVDPMALYHYFADKHALLREAAARIYGGLDTRAGRSGSWRQRLESLALAYVELLARSGELLRYLTAQEGAAVIPQRLFEERFREAVAPLALPRASQRAAHDAYVDFLHGFSLGVRAAPSPALRRRLREELAVLLAGIGALARHP